MSDFAKDFIEGYTQGQQLRQQRETHQQQAEAHKLNVQQQKLVLDAAKLQQALHLREAAVQNANLSQGKPGQTVPDTSPGNVPDETGYAPQGGGGTQVLPLPPVQIPGIPAIGDSPAIPGTSIQPQTLQELMQQRNLQANQEAMTKISTEPQFGDASGRIYNRFTGDVAQEAPPKPEAPVKPEPLTPQSVNVDGKGALVLRDNQGNFFDVLTKKPITGRITPYVTPAAPRQKGEITPTAEAGLVQQLNKQWEAASKDVQALYRANAIMDAGMEAARKGDLNAGAQAVLVTFQKFLDPTSVVRESEYARSGAGLAMAERIRGAMEKLEKGGAGVPLGELEKFSLLGKEITARLTSEGNSLLSSEKRRITGIADRYGVPSELVIPKYDFATPQGTAAPAAETEYPEGTVISDGKTIKVMRGGKWVNP